MSVSINSLSSVLSNLPSIASAQYATAGRFTLGCGIGCALIATEMAIRAMRNISSGLNNDIQKNEFSNNLAGSLFYGICATNILPVTPIVGIVVFAGYSLVESENEKSYIISSLFRKILEPVFNHVFIPLSKYTVEHILIPVTNTIVNIFAAILGLIELPSNPTWYGVAALIVGVALKVHGII